MVNQASLPFRGFITPRKSAARAQAAAKKGDLARRVQSDLRLEQRSIARELVSAMAFVDGLRDDLGIVRAITVKPQWAELIARNEKTIENRSWRPQLLGPGVDHTLLVHAGAPVGAVVAVCRVAAIGTSSGLLEGNELSNRNAWALARPWFTGPIGWLLSDVQRLAKPVPSRGAQGLWAPKTEILQRVLEQL